MNLIDEINKEIEIEIEKSREVQPITIDDLRLETLGEVKETKPAKRKRGRPAKGEESVFIEMWNAALENGSLNEVAKMLGSSPASTAVKASNLRKRGVELGRFKRGRRKKV